MADLDFGDPIVVNELPPAKRGGRASAEPALRTWLSKIPNGKTVQLGAGDSDGAHSTSRVSQLREIAGDDYAVETRSVEAGKRYLVFVTKLDAKQKAERIRQREAKAKEAATKPATK